ncbi:MAG: hypothetical protein Roseis2KO_35790 [Roseivirga sp.]
MKTEEKQKAIRIKDERLDVDHIDHYHLSFFIGTSACEICVYDDRKNRVLLFESIPMDTNRTLLENLKVIHHDHSLISAGFWKTVSITLRNHSFAQVPNELYSGDYAYDYIKLNAHTDPLNEKYVSTLDETRGCTTVFAVPHELIRWIDGKYPKPDIVFRHESANFLKTLTGLVDKEADQLFVNMTGTDMLLAGFKEGKLAIYNQFRLQNAQQAAKMILLSTKQFSDQGQAISITMWGVKETVKQYEPTLKKFFKYLTKGDRPKGLRMNHDFDQLKDYEYFDVFASYQ